MLTSSRHFFQRYGSLFSSDESDPGQERGPGLPRRLTRSQSLPQGQSSSQSQIQTPGRQLNEPLREPIVSEPSYPYDCTVRVEFTRHHARIYAWPSRGGVIILEDANAVDLEFLEFDPLYPPVHRIDDQKEEDIFCQCLLLLGAKWWDSLARYCIVADMETKGRFGNRRIDRAWPLNEQALPTMRERRFVKVGWPESGGLWVAEFDDAKTGARADIGHLHMARTMDERCEILETQFDATFYEDIYDYADETTFLRCWATKRTGEAGPLLMPHQLESLYWKKFYGRDV